MLLLVEQGLVDLSEYTVDGTTLEANARTHSAVWAKNTNRWRQAAIERIEALFDEIQQLADLEDAQYGDQDLPERGEQADWDSDGVQAAARQIESALDNQQAGGEVAPKDLGKARTRLKRIKGKELEKLKKYEQQLQTLDGRNSYSKTDSDATFMRLKGQSPFDKILSPAYNLQMGCQNQFILGYSLHSNAADKANLAAHLDRLSFEPEWLCGDAGYSSLANFQMLDARGIKGVIKSPGDDRKPKPYERRSMDYDRATDSWRCPQGRTMKFAQTTPYPYGQDQTTSQRRYECQSCADCPVKSECTKAEGNRSITIIPVLEACKKIMNNRRSTGIGKKMTRYRGCQIESVFGQLKYNDRLDRLDMRGQKMVTLEVGLKSIAHNLRKMHAILKNAASLFGQNAKLVFNYNLAA